MNLPIDRRSFLVSLPALMAAHRLMAQGTAPQIRVNGLSQMTLTVADPKRSIEFYQGLFGMPVLARQGTTTYLRIGAGPRFLAIVPAGPGERPSISRFGMAIDQFNVDNILKILAQHGVTPADAANTTSASGGPMKVRVVTRGDTREMYVGDSAGIVFQLHDASYCGGSGPLGNMCKPEPAPTKGLLAVRDMSHFTISAASAQFYQDVFGMPVQVMQATTPGYAVGPGVHFLMFTGGGGAGRGAAPGGAAGAAAGAGRGAGAAAGGAPGAAAGGAAGAPAGGGAAAAGAAPPAGGAAGAGRGAGGAQAAGGADPAARGAGAGGGGGRGGGAARGGAPTGPNIDHACMALDNFVPEAVTKALTDYGLKPGPRSEGALMTYITVRMENRGGAPVTGTPELYFTDPDGLAIQLQDTKYCGGGGFLGDICPG